MASSTVSITPEVEGVLRASVIEQNRLTLPGTLDRRLYMATNKVLELLGGKWNRREKAHVFEDDPGFRIQEALDAGELVDPVKFYQFYPTPSDVAVRLVFLAGVADDHRVLEPSAGNGSIIKAMPYGFKVDGLKVDACEIQDSLREEIAPLCNLVGTDFLAYEPGPIYDRIVANPPFTKGQSVKHANHMLDCLKPGGRLVCVMDAGVKFRQNRATTDFRARVMLECQGVRWISLDSGAFKASGTMVNTVILVATKK